MAPSDFVKKGVGFVCSQIEFNFKKPINSKQEAVYIESSNVEFGGTFFKTKLEIFNSENKEKLYSDGTFTIHIVDSNTEKPTEMPLWSQKFFWELAG